MKMEKSNSTVMKRSKFTEAQIVRILQSYDNGRDTESICREQGISKHTFYNWRRKYVGMDALQLKELKALQEENAGLDVCRPEP
ncbi:MAG: transposase [Flavobacteriales bacterium]|nr:transposase [Flavobacteriales bacterium]